MKLPCYIRGEKQKNKYIRHITYTVEPRYNEVLENMKITLLYQGEQQNNIKGWN